jgi:hypothetical protein
MDERDDHGRGCACVCERGTSEGTDDPEVLAEMVDVGLAGGVGGERDRRKEAGRRGDDGDRAPPERDHALPAGENDVGRAVDVDVVLPESKRAAGKAGERERERERDEVGQFRSLQ